ncbi:biopolymer transporter ExbD [Parvularcula sp. LCG005]|uniref:ExbD/TolR family protein n=1 Tax=Parvularcula sp. LCG005 TaxID=3078805 RepID=UPI002943F636|nr:biopolymer transporter ExbD [Parvularcula sp. LCG005]WOI53624.1 biopolymer transporter ExbD [Parvularcula sp. LCG005]
MATGGDDDVNVTPLLDIVFIMLIFFIVTSTFIKEPGVQIEKPLVTTGIDQRQVAILVGITSDSRIFIDKEETDISEVRYKVQELRKETPKGAAVVQVDQGANSRTLLDVLEQIKNAGIQDVAVSTEEA